MVRLNIITHNLWLIPFAGPWFLGRAARCADNLARATTKLQQSSRGDEDDTITVVALQEVWAVRAGMLWPFLWAWAWVERLLLQLGVVNGGYEPLLYKIGKALVFLVLIVSVPLSGDTPRTSNSSLPLFFFFLILIVGACAVPLTHTSPNHGSMYGRRLFLRNA